jgi:hypothetical protein
MTFSFFRKHQSLFLWAAVIFCVMVFATFSGFSDLQAMFQGSGRVDTVGRFTTVTSNELVEVGQPEFMRTRNAMNRFRAVSGSAGDGVEDSAVWQFLMLREDALGAGLAVADAEVAGFIHSFMGDLASKQMYVRLWRDLLQFSSARECEQFFHDMILGTRWADLRMQASRIVNADEVYTRWSSDNMRFDIEAVLIPDTPLEAIVEPPREELQAWFDEQPEAVREYRYSDPKKHDIVYAWLPLDAGADQISDEALMATGELGETEVDSRYNLLKPTLWPDAEAMDDEMRAVVERQLRVIRHVQQTRDAYDLLDETGEEAFRSHMAGAGLTVAETTDPIDAEALKVLDPIGDEALPLWLDQIGEGQTHFGYPYRDQTTAYAVFVRGVVPSRPLSFDEGYDKILESWKEGERNRVALDWREAITEAARDLPEAVAITQPILDQAETDIAAQLAEQPDLDEEGQAALRDEIMQVAEQDVDVRVADFEHLAWDAAELPATATRLSLADVPRGYGRMLDGDEDPDGIERFLKINTAIYRLAVNGISQTLRNPATEQTAVVRVVETRLPPMDEMWGDEAGMEQSRQLLGRQREITAADEFSPDVIAASHALELIVYEDEEAEGEESPE